MLQLAQRTEAPNSTKVSMSTAVSMVMCNEPETRTPLSGFWTPYFSRTDIRPGISCSATEISLRPQSAKVMSLTLKSVAPAVVVVAIIVVGWSGRLFDGGAEGGDLVGQLPREAGLAEVT